MNETKCNCLWDVLPYGFWHFVMCPLFSLGLLLSSIPTVLAVPATDVVMLSVNDQHALELPGRPVRVLVADPAIADVQVLDAAEGRPLSVMVLGRKPGSTKVQVWLRGQEHPRITRVKVLGDMQASTQGISAVNVEQQGSAVVLSGNATSVDEHRVIQAAAVDAVGNDKVLDTTLVGQTGTVQVEVKVVEVSRTVLKDVGLTFDASNTRGGFSYSAGGGRAVTGGWSLASSLIRGAFNLDVTLSLLQSNGLARVLAEPTLLAMSGQSASFLAGGEIPVPVAGSLGTQSVEYKAFGIGLTVTPTILAANRIALKVAPEASELDYANAVPISQGESVTLMPALRTRRADTMVELGDGESFVIGGLVSRNTLAAVYKVPFLGDLPIIGAFFRNMRYSQDEKELVIVVTPRLVRPVARGVNLPLPGEAEEQRDSASTAWGYYLMGPAIGDDLPGFSR